MRLLIKAEDYHEFQNMATAIINFNLKWIELGVSGRDYIGLMFDDCKPSDEEIKTLLETHNIKLSVSYVR